jgi:phosphopantetheine adenylyltransferase
MTIDLIHLESIKQAKLLSSIIDATGETSTVRDTEIVVIQMRETGLGSRQVSQRSSKVNGSPLLHQTPSIVSGLRLTMSKFTKRRTPAVSHKVTQASGRLTLCSTDHL